MLRVLKNGGGGDKKGTQHKSMPNTTLIHQKEATQNLKSRANCEQAINCERLPPGNLISIIF